MSFKDLNVDLDEEDVLCCDECGTVEGECHFCEACDFILCDECFGLGDTCPNCSLSFCEECMKKHKC